MRTSSMLVSGAVAAVAVAGSASAGVVDPFTTAATFSGAGAVWTSMTGGLFAERKAQRFNSATASISTVSNSWTFSLPNSGSSTSSLNYRMDSNDGTTDLSGIASMSFGVSGLGSGNSLTLNWYVVDINYSEAKQTNGLVTVSANGTQTFNFSTAAVDPGFDWTQVTSMTVSFGAASANSGATVSNFNFTAVPAPGAAALVGLAGIIAGRRRKA